MMYQEVIQYLVNEAHTNSAALFLNDIKPAFLKKENN